MNKLNLIPIILLVTVGTGLVVNAGQIHDPLAGIPSQELRLVQKFLGAHVGETNVFARLVVDKEVYVILMDRSHRKAAILNRDPERERVMGEVGSRGFFSKDSRGNWVRDAREEFEMGGGIWMLNRFLRVLKRSETARFTKLKWKGY